jgi:uncharacterized protein (DUF305 family)
MYSSKDDNEPMTEPRRSLISLAPALALALALAAPLAVTGCDPGGGTKADGGGPSVIAPGRPGEDASTLSAEEAAQARPDDTPNEADSSYVTRMIEHHRQALVMAALAAGHAGAAKVKSLAGRIEAAQGPEIATMQAWLDTNGGSDHSAHHSHDRMPGMATDQQLAALRKADGAAFDRLFLTLMIAHHQGAVTMATEVLSGGRNVQVEEWANEVIAQQSSEIRRMRALR